MNFEGKVSKRIKNLTFDVELFILPPPTPIYRKSFPPGRYFLTLSTPDCIKYNVYNLVSEGLATPVIARLETV